MGTSPQKSYKVSDDAVVVDEFTAATERLGLSRSAAVGVFMRMFNERGGFPFEVVMPSHARYVVPARNAQGEPILPADWDDAEDEGLYDDIA